MPTPPRQLYRSELFGADAVWLLEVRFAGREWRWSSLPIDVTNAAGETLRFHGGLDLRSLEDELAVMTSEPEVLSASFDVLWPEGQDLAELIGWGHDFGSATGELAVIVSGSTYENRQVVIDGRVIEPEYGEQYEPVSFSLEALPWQAAQRFASTRAGVVTRTTTFTPYSPWEAIRRMTPVRISTALEVDYGKRYPLVIGAPGNFIDVDGTEKNVPGSPVIVTNTNVIGDGTKTEADEIAVAVGGTDTTTATLIYTDAEGDRQTVAITNLVEDSDDLGTRIVTSDINTELANQEQQQGYPFFLSWSNGGALRNPFGPGDLESAGDVCRYMLSRANLQVDMGSWVAASAYLNRWTIGAYIDENAEPYQWLAENVFPLLPLTVHAGPRGKTPIIWRWDATKKDAIDHLEAGRRVDRVSPVAYERAPDELISEVHISWALDVDARAYERESIFLASVEIDPSTGQPYDQEEHATSYAKSAASRLGRARVDSLETDVLYDFTSVACTAAWRLIAFGQAHRSVTYDVPSWYQWLPLGAVVTVTDASLGWSNRIALVQGISLVDTSTTRVRLAVIETPDRVKNAL